MAKHLTPKELDDWAATAEPGRYLVRLELADRIPWSARAHPSRYFEGPAVVELVRMRGGGWEVYETPVLTPDMIAKS